MCKLLIRIGVITLIVSGCSFPSPKPEQINPAPTFSPTPTTNTVLSRLTEAEARSIAESILNRGEELTSAGTYNQFSQTWWFDVNLVRQGCFPAIVVYEGTKKTDINWRCTGVLQPMNGK